MKVKTVLTLALAVAVPVAVWAQGAAAAKAKPAASTALPSGDSSQPSDCDVRPITPRIPAGLRRADEKRVSRCGNFRRDPL